MASMLHPMPLTKQAMLGDTAIYRYLTQQELSLS